MPSDTDLGPGRRHHDELGAQTVFECSECGERYLGERRCPDCGCHTRRVGAGGHCPECDQLLTIAELLESRL